MTGFRTLPEAPLGTQDHTSDPSSSRRTLTPLSAVTPRVLEAAEIASVVAEGAREDEVETHDEAGDSVRLTSRGRFLGGAVTVELLA